MAEKRRVRKKRVRRERDERFPEKIPISLLVKVGKGEVEHSAKTVDISVLGLQVETRGALAPGQEVTVSRFGNCEVVWVRQGKRAKLLLAGLKAVK